jgi:hypothetical protein
VLCGRTLPPLHVSSSMCCVGTRHTAAVISSHRKNRERDRVEIEIEIESEIESEIEHTPYREFETPYRTVESSHDDLSC